MKKKPTIYEPIVFDDRAVFVCPVTDKVRVQDCEGDFENPYYSLVDAAGKRHAIVQGESDFAFQVVKEHHFIPQWAH